jgi:flagellar biosynthesis protein FlhF
MDLRTYRAKSLAEALRLVREDLGPEASVLHTRQVGGGAWRWLVGGPDIEVTASSQVQAPAILGDDEEQLPRADLLDFRSQFREHVRRQRGGRSSALEDLIPQPSHSLQHDLPALLARIGRRLAGQHIDPATASQLIEELRDAAELEGLWGWRQLCKQLVQLVAGRLAIGAPLRLLPATRRVVALVGPTGVGKTTTLAKLAANFHVRERKRVGLITVDTYRVAAVEQLRTYAQIMHLPMEVVATAREMRAALDRLQEMDLVLLDTAGRSPRDAQQIGQLADLLAEARPDETHLVLASVAAASSLAAAAETFAAVGASALVLTKFDEVTALGSLLPLLCNPRLPVSYLTDGQNVPHTIFTRRTVSDWRNWSSAMPLPRAPRSETNKLVIRQAHFASDP